jgi:hypothetical protein
MQHAEKSPGEVWDEILASELSRQSTTTTRPSGCARLTLWGTPRPRHLKNLRRILDEINPSLRKVLRELIQGERPWPLLLSGDVGAGKSAAALCLLDYAGGEYYTAETLAAEFIAAQQGRVERGPIGNKYDVYPEDLWGILDRAPLVVLDELATRSTVSDHHYNTVKRLIDLRLGKPFIAVTNCEEHLLAAYDDRVVSRLRAGTAFLLEGDDRRII